jgi:hypothetical protein
MVVYCAWHLYPSHVPTFHLIFGVGYYHHVARFLS